MPPFSTKQKKKQLQEKRERKRDKERQKLKEEQATEEPECRPQAGAEALPTFQHGGDRRGVRSVFSAEHRDDVAARRQASYQPLAARDFRPGIPFGRWFSLLGVEASDTEHHTCSATFPFSVELPRRVLKVAQLGVALPPCVSTADAIHSLEHASFERMTRWLDSEPFRGQSESSAIPEPLRGLRVNAYEKNLDVWRQLWRTVEQSDVVAVIADVRYALVHLPVSLLDFIIQGNGKPCVILLNKADLVPPDVLREWQQFLGAYFVAVGLVARADAIPVLPFTSIPEDILVGSTQLADGPVGDGLKRRKAKTRRTQKMYAQMQQGLNLREGGEGDHSEALSSSSDDSTFDVDVVNFKGMTKVNKELARNGTRTEVQHQQQAFATVASMIQEFLSTCQALHQERLGHNLEKGKEIPHMCIGFVGHPNVGKSSLINCIAGGKVVSVSSSAGHTKHLQTIGLEEKNVTLLDCPGLAFPTFGVPRPLQAVIGTHQIAQTCDPQSGVGYLASRLPLEKIYGLRREDDSFPWSPYELSESYATKRGYMVKRGKGTPDVHRGAIEILKEAYEGRLVLYFQAPPLTLLEVPNFLETLRPLLHLRVPENWDGNGKVVMPDEDEREPEESSDSRNNSEGSTN